ncbi:uncharacterized protein [Musca autumnalis]|uniref:uncharacterized protein n=1 Tax=Musca autumnalis TaxID=221902 RepID=UPI003CEA37AC
MKLYTLFSCLAICLMAFAANVNSVYIDSEGHTFMGTVGPVPEGATTNDAVTDSTDETTVEPTEATDAPDNHGPDELNIEELHRFTEHLMDVVGQLIGSVLQAVYDGKPLEIKYEQHPYKPHPQLPHHEDSDEDNHVPEYPNGNQEYPEHHEESEEDNHLPEDHKVPEEDNPVPENHEEPKEDKHVAEPSKESEEDKHVSEPHEEPKKEEEKSNQEPEENQHVSENHDEPKKEPNEDKPVPEHHEKSEGKDNNGQENHELLVENEEPQPVIQPRTIFSAFWWLVKSVMKTLRGINCTIKGVVNVRDSTGEMLRNFQRCEANTVKEAQAVVDSAQKVLSLTNEILHINDEVCGNPNYTDENVDPKAKVSASCAKQLRSKIISLNNQIKTTVKLTKKVPKDAGDCALNTFTKYRDSIADFPGFVKECKKFK